MMFSIYRFKSIKCNHRIDRVGRLFFLFLSLFLAAGVFLPSQESLKYDISVSAKVVPIFAVDSRGEPVFDLRKDELELYINGKPLPIDDFQRYTFQGIQKTGEETIVRKRKKRAERVVFVIIDSIYNSHYGFGRTKKIAVDLIRKSPPGDSFVILENTPAGGLKFIAGCDGNRAKAIEEIGQLKMPHEKWSRDIFQSREYDKFLDFNAMQNAAELSRSLKLVQNRQLLIERMRYQNQVKYFARSLTKLKYALNTITKPKIVFLISEGIAKGAFNANLEESEPAWGKFHSAFLVPEKTAADKAVALNTRLYKYLLDVVKAINHGGSVLYTINPAKVKSDEENIGDLSLMTLSGESGGRYIAGSDLDTVVQKIGKTTAAYYEVIFSLGAVASKRMDVEVKCKRSGVKINTLNHAEKEKPYRQMEKLRKKLFALDVVQGGSWSRIVGQVVRVKVNKLADETRRNKTLHVLDIPLPEKMKNRKVDIFALRVHPETHKVDIRFITRKVKDRVELKIEEDKERRLYFAIIEPLNTYCLYNRVI